MFAALISTMNREFTMGTESDKDTAEGLNQSTTRDRSALSFQPSFCFIGCLLALFRLADACQMLRYLSINNMNHFQIGGYLLPSSTNKRTWVSTLTTVLFINLKYNQHVAPGEILYTWT